MVDVKFFHRPLYIPPLTSPKRGMACSELRDVADIHDAVAGGAHDHIWGEARRLRREGLQILHDHFSEKDPAVMDMANLIGRLWKLVQYHEVHSESMRHRIDEILRDDCAAPSPPRSPRSPRSPRLAALAAPAAPAPLAAPRGVVRAQGPAPLPVKRRSPRAA